QQSVQQKLVHAAAGNGNLRALEYLYLIGVPLDGYDENGLAPLHGAVINNHHATTDFLLTHGCHARQPDADAAKTTAFALAKTSTMKKLLESYLGQQEIPDFPPPLPYVATEEQAPRLGNPPPTQVSKEGLTLQECAFMERFGAQYSTEYYAMAL